MRIICHGLTNEDFPVEFIDHEITLGSKESSGIAIQAPGIAECHAFLREDGDDLFIEDNDSLDGTFLNHRKIQNEEKISSGDIIQIGSKLIRVDFLPDQTVTLNFIPDDKDADNQIDVTAMTIMPAAAKAQAQQSPAPGDDVDKTMVQTEVPTPTGVSTTSRVSLNGQVIGKYVVVKQIGKGGMGEVYLAKHKTLGTYRALKILPKELLEDNDKFLERFIREAKLASEIRHPNVVGVMDVETDSSAGIPYIVMEYIDGGSLRGILKSINKLSEEQAVVVVEAIASALRAAEEHSIVHRDIKPDNIMFTKQGEVKLADLGIAKNDDADNELTRTNVMIGTPAYLSPEQAQNAKGVDARADIYSLGATFYEMLTGQHPYPGHNTFEILHKLFSDPVPDPRKINPEVSPASAAIVMKMLAKDAKDRFQSASELLETMDRTFPPHTAYESAELIKKVIAGECENNSAFSSSITTTQFAWQFKKYIKWAVAAAVVLFLGVGCLIALHFMKGKSSGSPSAAQDDRPETTPVVADTTPVKESLYDLQIKTTPDAEIHFISEDGLMRVYSSNHEGLLKIPGLQPGSYKIKISRNNYRPISQDIELNENMELDVPMVADLKKLVIKAQPGSEIRIAGVENGEKTVKASSDGTAEFPDLLGETVLVHIELPGWETYEQTLLLNKDQELQAPQKRIMSSLTVRTAPYADIVLKQNDEVVQSVKANSLGMVVVEGIMPGEYNLEISSSGYHSKEMACDLTRNQNLSVDLLKITYDLQINAAADTQIMLFLNHQLQGTYLVPASGSLRLAAMTPGNYSITAEKKGMVGQSFDVVLDKDMSFDCHLTEAVAVVAPEEKNEEKTEEKPPVPETGSSDTAVSQQDQQGSAPAEEVTEVAPPEKLEGTVKVSFLGSAELVNYIQEKGAEISIGDQTWSDIREFPWSQQLEAGEYTIRVQSDGIRDLLVENFTVEAGQDNECRLEPETVPSTIRFVSNQDDAVITFNDSSYKPGQEAECETFREFSVTGTCGDETISRTVRSSVPGEKLTLEFLFAEKEPEEPPEEQPQAGNSDLNRQYEEALKLFEDRKYKDALKAFTPLAEAGHKDAARKVAEINERGLGMWFSDSTEAMKWYRKAAELGDAESAGKVAVAIEDGSTKGTTAEMLKFYQMACTLNDADIFYRIANLYKNGHKDISPDPAKSIHYLTQAAELGNPDAMFDLGIRYEKGDGVVSNIQTALKWINKAADAGHDKAKRYSKQLRQ